MITFEDSSSLLHEAGLVECTLDSVQRGESREERIVERARKAKHCSKIVVLDSELVGSNALEQQGNKVFLMLLRAHVSPGLV